jgi:hypothetical protein
MPSIWRCDLSPPSPGADGQTGSVEVAGGRVGGLGSGDGGRMRVGAPGVREEPGVD